MKSAIVVAAGKSQRFESNKLFAKIDDTTVIQLSIAPFFEICDEVVLVVNESDFSDMDKLFFDKDLKIVVGGETRTLSVEKGLRALSESSKIVAIHDGARPFITKTFVENCFSCAMELGSAVPVLNQNESVYVTIEGKKTPQKRENIMLVQTPQVFSTQQIKEAYSNKSSLKTYTDDSQVFLDYFEDIEFVEGLKENKKITFATDLRRERIGNGFDVHQLVEGRKLILGGEVIDFSKGLLGHSDADVLAHAIMDSLLMAVQERDIGILFPDTDDNFKDISSMELLKNVAQILKEKSACVQNVSCVILAQAPRLAEFLPTMAKNIAQVLCISPANVNLSVTTTEHLGIIGEGKGIAAHATCLVVV